MLPAVVSSKYAAAGSYGHLQAPLHSKDNRSPRLARHWLPTSRLQRRMQRQAESGWHALS